MSQKTVESWERGVVGVNMSVCDMDLFESEIYLKIQEAEKEARSTDVRLSSEDVLKSVREVIDLYYIGLAKQECTNGETISHNDIDWS